MLLFFQHENFKKENIKGNTIMKRIMTIVIALALGCASVFARTPQEMVADKDWKAFSMCGFASITNLHAKGKRH